MIYKAIAETKRLIRLFTPYFGFSEKNRKHTLGIISIIISAITAAIAMVYVHDAFSAMHVIINAPTVTLSAIFTGAFHCLVPLCIWAGIATVTSTLTEWLGNSLTYTIKVPTLTKWMDDTAFHGMKFITKKGKKIRASDVLSQDIEETCNASTKLASSLVDQFIQFIVAAYQLWYLSVPLVVSLGSMSLAIPGYMMIGAMAYAGIYSLIIHPFASRLQSLEKDLKVENSTLSAHLYHIEEYSESIALKKGAANEKEGLLHTLNKIFILQSAKIFYNGAITFIQNVGSQMSFIFGFLLAGPGLATGTLAARYAYSVADYFTRIVAFFNWKKDHTTEFTSLDLSFQRLETFQNLMQEWDAIKAQAAQKLHTHHDSMQLGAKNLSLFTPSHTPILNNITLALPIGKATVVQGPSGVGKSTFIQALLGLWPYAEGEILFPKTEHSEALRIYCIPQKPYFPFECTLLEAICYPHRDTVSQEDKEEIQALMRTLNFKESIIEKLEKRSDWKSKLSGGEQQRIAIISAILKNPDILLMDEGTNGIDPENELITKELIKEKLKGKTIIAIDHHVKTKKKTDFFDYKLKIQKQPKAEPGEVSIQLKEIKKLQV